MTTVEEIKQSLRDGTIVMCLKSGGGESCIPTCLLIKRCWVDE